MASQTDIKVIIDAQDNASAVLKKVGNSASDAAKGIQLDFKAAGIAATAFLGSLTALAVGAMKVASSFEQNRISFETMMGSADMAKKMMTDLAKFTLETPFEMPQVVQGAKSLMAYGISAEKIIPTFKMLGDIAAGVGMDKLPNLVLAFGQVKAATRLTGMELRQFTEAGVPLLDMLATQMGKTVAEIKDMITEGKVGFPVVQKALESLTGSGGKFENLMLKQSKSFAGLMSNIKDKITQTMSEIAGVSVATGEVREGSLFAVLKEGAEKLYAAIDVVTPKIIEFTNWLASNKDVLIVVAGALAGLVTVIAVGLISAFGAAIATAAAFAAVGAALAGIFILVRKAWATDFLGIQTIIQGFFDRFKLGWEIMKAVVQAVTDWLTETAWPAFQSFFNFIKALVDYFVAVWQFAWAVVKTVVEALWNWFWNWAGPTITAFFNLIKQAVQVVADWFEYQWFRLKQAVAIVVDWFMSHVYPTLEKAFGLVKGAVEEVRMAFAEAFDKIKEKVEGVINFIRDLIDKFKPKISIGLDLPDIEGAWRNLKQKAHNLGVPGFQTGGIVPGPVGQPTIAMVHGGEKVIPSGLSRGGGGSGGVTLNVSIGLYAGTETEKRNIARDLYVALAQVAQSQNKSVRELIGA